MDIEDILTKEDIDKVREKFTENYIKNIPASHIVSVHGDFLGIKLDIHKEKTEKFVGQLCCYLAYKKGFWYYPFKKIDGVWG